MRQKFSNEELEKFKKYLSIKDTPSEIEKIYIEKTKKYCEIISFLPGLKMIGIGNSIAMNNAKKESDIDLYIVSSEYTMWLNRILITLIFQLLGVRKNEKKHEGRFCLSFFSTEKGMDFSEWKIENDIYLYFWIVYFKPIISNDNSYERFIKLNSSWADFDYYKNIIKENKTYILKSEEKGDGKTFKLIDNLCKKLFSPKTLSHYNKIGKPYGVIVNDNLLKFHNGDIRKK